MAFNKDELKEIAKLLDEQGMMQDKLNESMGAYVQHLKTIAELQKNINHVSETIVQLKDEEKKLSEDLQKLIKDRHKGSKQEQAETKKEIKLIIDKIKAKRTSLNLSEEGLQVLEEANKRYVEQAQSVNKVNLGLKEGVKMLKQTPGLILKGYGKLREYGLFEMDKAIRMAGVEMGKVVNVGSKFGKDIVNASTETQSMGMHVKDLAKIQGVYSSELGRSVTLSQEGLEAMSQMASGTILGAEGAASLAADMDSFNISVTKSAGIIEETINMAEQMGLNAGKVIKNLQNNLKMANKYHFKGGVNGMVKMAAQAEKFNMSMETTAGLADKLFDIEGAVEMSAQLNTMGGEWSKLGDPMKLMYQARNDMEGLQTSIIDATAGMADFNKETGEFSFSGLELHRMRELEKITGISAEEMANMAKSKARFAKIDAKLGMDINPEMKEFIENTAVFEDGEFKIKLSGEKDMIPIDKLSKLQKEGLIAESKRLKERAKNSQTFDEQMSNMIENAKTLLLPLLEGLNNALPDISDSFNTLMKTDLANGIKSAAKMIGVVVRKAIGLFTTFPKTFTGVALLLLTPAKWILNGISLAKGFMMGSKGFGGGSYGVPGGLIGPAQQGGGGSYGVPGGLIGPAQQGGGGLSRMGVGMGLGLGGMALEAGRGMLDNPNGTGGKMMGVGSSALTGAAMGMMLGPIGALVGGVLGAAYGAISEFGQDSSGKSVEFPKAPTTKGINDGIIANGKITPIDTKDQVYQVSKPGGAFDKAGGGKPGGGTTNKSSIHISFDTIHVKSEGNVGKIDLENDSAFMQKLATKIKESLSKSANGGVLNPNPL